MSVENKDGFFMTPEDIDRLAEVLAEKVEHRDFCPFREEDIDFIHRLRKDCDDDTWTTLIVMGKTTKRAATAIGTVFIAGLVGVVVWAIGMAVKKGWFTF